MPLPASHRSRLSLAAALAVPLLATSAVVVVAPGAAAGPMGAHAAGPMGAHAAALAPADRVPVVVVRTVEENGGTPDDLAQIAQRVLGDQNRAPELLGLNQGRVQADGGRLTTPESLLPGWVLILPAGAAGPDVQRAPAPADAGTAPVIRGHGKGGQEPGTASIPVTVVRTVEENGGTPDDLAQIAQRVLGDQNRAPEILGLNQDRVQADGGRLTTPESLLPGWVLILPAGATGSDVQQASAPADAASAPVLAGSGAAPSPSPTPTPTPTPTTPPTTPADEADGGAASQTAPTTVVRTVEENAGKPDSLAQIALRTLGDESRALEIFELNEGRAQADGATMTDPDLLAAGWVLLLPDDASGPDVLRPEAPDEDDALLGGRFGWPVVAAVVGGLLLALLTAALVLRRQLGTAARWAGRRTRTLRDRLRERRRRAASLRQRAVLAGQWSDDLATGFTARGVAAGLVDLPGGGPVAVAVDADVVTVLGLPATTLTAPWQPGPEPGSWSRPLRGLAPGARPSPPLARIGGDQVSQVFVDVSHCAGVLAIDGDPTIAGEVARAVAEELGSPPDVRLVALGASDLEQHGLPLPPDDADAALAGAGPGLVRTTLTRTALRGVLLAEDGVPQGEIVAAAARCAVPGSGWLLVAVGEVPGAHWRWTARGDGTLVVPVLDREIVAAGGPVAPAATADTHPVG